MALIITKATNKKQILYFLGWRFQNYWKGWYLFFQVNKELQGLYKLWEKKSTPALHKRSSVRTVQPAVGDPASAGGLDWVTHRGPFQPLLFCDSVTLGLYKYLRACKFWSLQEQSIISAITSDNHKTSSLSLLGVVTEYSATRSHRRILVGL